MPVTSPSTEPETDFQRLNGTLIMGGRVLASEMRRAATAEIAAMKSRYGIVPGLAVLRVGEDAASVSYAGRIQQSFGAAGLPVTIEALPATASRGMLQAELSRLNVLPEVAGIIVQMPLPPHFALQDVVDVLTPAKDVDGIHPVNVGKLALGLEAFVPATPAGGIALLDYYGIGIEGKDALVIGRSDVVGKPFANLLLARNATVTIAHSRSRDLPALVAKADIVASAVGKPGLVRGAWLKPGAVVLDFGVTIIGDKARGDVEYEAALGRAAACTPVPGGTGPVTNALLLSNTLKAIKLALG